MNYCWECLSPFKNYKYYVPWGDSQRLTRKGSRIIIKNMFTKMHTTANLLVSLWTSSEIPWRTTNVDAFHFYYLLPSRTRGGSWSSYFFEAPHEGLLFSCRAASTYLASQYNFSSSSPAFSNVRLGGSYIFVEILVIVMHDFWCSVVFVLF